MVIWNWIFFCCNWSYFVYEAQCSQHIREIQRQIMQRILNMRRRHFLDSIKAKAAITERAEGTLERRRLKNHSEWLQNTKTNIRSQAETNIHAITTTKGRRQSIGTRTFVMSACDGPSIFQAQEQRQDNRETRKKGNGKREKERKTRGRKISQTQKQSFKMKT